MKVRVQVEWTEYYDYVIDLPEGIKVDDEEARDIAWEEFSQSKKPVDSNGDMEITEIAQRYNHHTGDV